MFTYYLTLAMKSLRKTPLSTSLMVLAIACGIGISMTTLTLNHVSSNNPIPEKSDVLYAMQLQASGKESTWASDDDVPTQVTYQDAINIERLLPELKHTPMFKTGFAVRSLDPKFTPLLNSARMSNRHFFSMFNIDFIYGGAWSAEIDKNPARQVVIASDLNDKLFGGGDNIGKEIYLNNDTYRIVGITENFNPAPKFYDLNNGAFQNSEQVFLPISLTQVGEYDSWGNNNGWKEEAIHSYDDKKASEILWLQYWFEIPTQEAKAKVEQYLAGYVEQQKKLGRFERDDARAKFTDVQEWLVYNKVVSDDSNVLVGVSFLFLSVCLVNTIGLLLAKFLRSAPNVGVRRALGASQWQVFLQHLVEVGLLGFMGGLLGLGFAQIGLTVLKTQFRGFDVLATMDMTMFLAAPVIAVTATVLAGIYPAWRVCTTQPSIYLKTQ